MFWVSCSYCGWSSKNGPDKHKPTYGHCYDPLSSAIQFSRISCLYLRTVTYTYTCIFNIISFSLRKKILLSPNQPRLGQSTVHILEQIRGWGCNFEGRGVHEFLKCVRGCGRHTFFFFLFVTEGIPVYQPVAALWITRSLEEGRAAMILKLRHSYDHVKRTGTSPKMFLLVTKRAQKLGSTHPWPAPAWIVPGNTQERGENPRRTHPTRL